MRDNLENHFDAYVDPALRAAICARQGLDYGDLKVRAFIYATSSFLVLDAMDLDVDVRHVAMERLVAEPRLLADLVSFLYSNAVAAVPAYLDRVYAMGRRNHRAEALSPAERLERWEPWQIDVLRLLLEKYNTGDLYSQFGYDLSFPA